MSKNILLPKSEEKEKKEKKLQTLHPITANIIKSDINCRSMCGIPLSLFDMLHELLHTEKAYLKMSSLVQKDQLALLYTKLKTGNTNQQIAVTFFICTRTVTKVLTNLLNKLDNIIKNNGLLWWMSREEVDATMPAAFKKLYPNTRVVLDASEIKIQCPKRVDSAILCWSSYKSNHTLKFLIGT